MTQITEIAAYFAAHLPSDGAPPDEARDAWRATLRRARRAGAIGWLTRLVQREAPADPGVRARCEALRGGED